MLKDFLALFGDRRSARYLVAVLAGVTLVVVGVLQQVSRGNTTIVGLQDPRLRAAVVLAGAIIVLSAMLLALREAAPSKSKAELTLLSYYQALNELTPAGFERAWSMLSDAKRARFGRDFGWHNSSDFSSGFNGVFSHEPVLLSRATANDRSETFLVFFLANEEYPGSPAREILLGTESQPVQARSVLTVDTMRSVTEKTAAALEKDFEVSNRTHVRRQISTELEDMTLEAIMSPKLVETVGLRLRLPRKPRARVKNQIGNQGGYSRFQVVNVQRRTVVKESGDWHIGDVDLLAECPLRS